jgi:hypothetical protein
LRCRWAREWRARPCGGTCSPLDHLEPIAVHVEWLEGGEAAVEAARSLHPVKVQVELLEASQVSERVGRNDRPHAIPRQWQPFEGGEAGERQLVHSLQSVLVQKELLESAEAGANVCAGMSSIWLHRKSSSTRHEVSKVAEWARIHKCQLLLAPIQHSALQKPTGRLALVS